MTSSSNNNDNFYMSLTVLNVDIGKISDLCKEMQKLIISHKAKLNQFTSTNNGPQEEIERCRNDIASSERHCRMYGNMFSVLREKIIATFDKIFMTCQEKFNITSTKLLNWKNQQKVAQYGGPDVTVTLKPIANEIYFILSLNDLHRCKDLMNHVVTCISHLKSLATILTEVSRNHDDINRLDASFASLIQKILGMSFIVLNQPPMLVKCKLTMRISLLTLDVSNLGSVSMKTQCRIISENTALAIQQNQLNFADKIETEGTIDVKQKDLESFTDGYIGAEFRKCAIKVKSRKVSSTKDSEAVKAKYYFLFNTCYKLFDQSLQLYTLSLPFMVSVHGSQDTNLLPKMFWDMAFSTSPDAIPMVGPAAIPWPVFASALQKLFLQISGCARGLTSNDMKHLKNRMFNEAPPSLSQNIMITWDMFAEDKLVLVPRTEPVAYLASSFWNWFYHIAEMLNEKKGHETKVKTSWDDGLVEGFISKDMAEQKLKGCKMPTFLLRFSDNCLGSVSAVVYYGHLPVVHLKPFKSKMEVEKFTLPYIVHHCQELENVNTLYPDKPKTLFCHDVQKEKKTNSPPGLENIYSPFTINYTCSHRGQNGKTIQKFVTTERHNSTGPPSMDSMTSRESSETMDSMEQDIPMQFRSSEDYQPNFETFTMEMCSNFETFTMEMFDENELYADQQFTSFDPNAFEAIMEQFQDISQPEDDDGDVSNNNGEQVDNEYM